ncbi:cytochrome-b5 reductase [Malassezia sp. CBS 17886]|nr:cytochrome-b5 reductase [Malassezia sp. CBS 17886]
MDPQVLAAGVIGLILSLLTIFFLGGTIPRKAVLSKEEWRHFKLISKTPVSKTSAIYRFALPRSSDSLDLPIGQHVFVRAMVNGRHAMRSYTPITVSRTKGYFDLMVKTYPTGTVSRHFDQLEVGDTMEFKGPKGQFRYSPNLVQHMGLIAGGTGITPVLQVVLHSLENPDDHTRFDLIYANQTEDEILLKDVLDELSQKYPDRFSVHYFLDVPPPGWTEGVGFVTKEAMEKYLVGPDGDCKVLMCGPPPMIAAMKKNLTALGYPAARAVSQTEDMVFCF